MKRLLTLFAVVLMGCSILCAQQKITLKLVTPQMSQKMYLTIKANPNITLLMYRLLGASSTLDGELKIEAIAEHPDDAKKALNKLCAFLDGQGGDNYVDINLLQVFRFTARETQLAKAIYSDYKDEQIAIKEQQKIQTEVDRIRRWERYGKDVFDFDTNDYKLTVPYIELDIDKAITFIDSIITNTNNSRSKEIATIDFIISDKGKVENFNTAGRYGNVFSADNFRPEEPAHYNFEYLDTIVCVPCKVNIPITEEWGEIQEIEIEIKYNRKKNSWKISPYNPSEEIKPDDLHIINRFLESLPMDDPLRKNKKSLRIGVGKHWIEFNNGLFPLTFPLTHQCRIIKHLGNKSPIQVFGEKHLNW